MFPVESEEFYDSLDEGSDRRHKLPETPQEEDDIIPFYDKNISRSEIELSGNSSKSTFLAAPQKMNSRRKKKGYSDKLKSVSYLDMFHARTGVNNYCGDKTSKSSRSPESLDSPNSFLTCDDSDGTSFYLKSEHSESCYDNHSTLRENPDLALPIANTHTDSKKMRTKQDRKTNSSFVEKSLAVKRTYSKINSTKLPEMGRLGPEIPTDKLELLRKRQQYGRKVSQTYGIKMKEKKVLQNLKEEISNSKICT